MEVHTNLWVAIDVVTMELIEIICSSRKCRVIMCHTTRMTCYLIVKVTPLRLIQHKKSVNHTGAIATINTCVVDNYCTVVECNITGVVILRIC